MKLIIREYLANLKERKELDALLPDLLSQMGLDVFSKPDVGGRQYGVDVAAFGSIDGKEKKVYLFSVKSGDLGRKDWAGDAVQDLKPSLDEIIEVYINGHLPPKYNKYPIVICLCFGGDVKESVRLNVSKYEELKTTDRVSFEEWNGEVLANHIEDYFLRDELLPKESRKYLRKSLAILNEPDESFNYFKKLAISLTNIECEEPKEVLRALRQLSISLWILYAWSRDEDNLESIYCACEFSLLRAWKVATPYFAGKKNVEKNIESTLNSIINLYHQLSDEYLQKVVHPHVGNLYALSSSINSHNSIDVNIKLFDILGRVAIHGLWSYSYLSKEYFLETESLMEGIRKQQDIIIQLINNNPLLMTPYKDEQAIDIFLAILFLSINRSSNDSIYPWLLNMIHSIDHQFKSNGMYPNNLSEYYEIIQHPKSSDKSYLEEVTQGSILFPIIAAYAAKNAFGDIYKKVQEIKKTHLSHCNFQVWYPLGDSEEHFYSNTFRHGGVLSVNSEIIEGEEVFLKALESECEATEHFKQLSAVALDIESIILLACRHYRIPPPLHFLFNTGEVVK
ncbi:hypothetical protein [Pseudoalteromonas fuliginea]|uniref:hypothetical protein n=2 Tax=Pseudoalteromonas fuliginea TaxID=1872678 RepID=UPI00317F3CE6